MRRRTRTGTDGAPAHLQRYDPADWPNPECHPECAFWEAVAQWREERPEDDDEPLVLVDGPDVPWHPNGFADARQRAERFRSGGGLRLCREERKNTLPRGGMPTPRLAASTSPVPVSFH